MGYPSSTQPPNMWTAQSFFTILSRSSITAISYVNQTQIEYTLSYEELHAKAGALAGRIRNFIQGSGDSSTSTPEPFVVPLLISQSPELYIAQVAILKAGAAFCPLNLDAPSERINFILNDVAAQVVICSAELAEKIPRSSNRQIHVITIDLTSTTKKSECTATSIDIHTQLSSESLAYVMYTSGSTGTPKGVGISHRAATQALLAHDRHIPNFKRFLQFAAPTFDVSVFEIFFTFMRGSTLICCDRGEMLSNLPGTIMMGNVDACELTPSVAGSLLKSRQAVPCLKLLLTIGEMLTESVVKEFGGDSAEDSILWGMYGPTEATIHCTLQPAFLKKQSRKNIGFPLENVSAFIIDADPSQPFQALPLGQPGELVVGGSQLAIGYVNRPEQTSAAFIDSPYGRIYRTGDKAIMMADGTIECLGRISDTQVKLNGQRMELGEVEQIVLGAPGCHSAVAAIVSNTLVAFAAVDRQQASEQAIMDRCKSWLPAFMVPADIRLMDDFPRLPSGKVDRKNLVAEYEVEQQGNHQTREKPADDLEHKLCLVASVLLDRQVQPSSRLASVGIDSLMAIEYASNIRASGIPASVLDILRSTTIHDLHNTLKRRVQKLVQPFNHDRQDLEREVSSRPTPKVLEGLLENILLDRITRIEHCTTLQKSMISETLQDPRLYVNELRIGFPLGTNPEDIREWFRSICGQNEVLRSGFVQADNQLYQITWDTVQEEQIKIVEDFVRTKPNNTEQYLQHPLEVQITNSPASTSQGPVAMIVIHHAIYDGWSSDLLLRSLNYLYRGESLPAASQFNDVVGRCEALGMQYSVDDKEYWAEQLRSSMSSIIPNFRTAPVEEAQIRTIRRSLAVPSRHVKDTASQMAISDQVVFQASLAWLWSAVTGAEDVVIGSVFSGRTLPVDGIESAMGPFMATLPLRVQFGQFETTTELLQVIQASNRSSLQHGGLSLSEIKRAAGLPQRARVFDVIFAYQESLLSRKAATSAVREISHTDAVEAKLLVEIQPEGGGLSCQMTWHTEVFSEAFITSFVLQLESVVQHFLRKASGPLADIRGCFPRSLLSTFNETPTSLDILPSLAALVEESVEKYSENVAIHFADSIDRDAIESQSLTYFEMNSRANQIARCLQSCGVQPGEIVAIIMEKSPLLYCSILAILKTGSAYLPMLPSTPGLRKQRIVEQAKPRLCLTSSDLEDLLASEGLEHVVPISFESVAHHPVSNFGANHSLEALAYVIYTSGTTGVPKGVAVTNRNMLSNIKALSALYPHSPSSKMLQACSQAFDVSVFEIFFAWANGMCLCAATNDTLFGNLSQAVNRFEVTHLSMTVTVASLLRPEEVPCVEFLVTSGEAMTDEVLDKWAKQLWQGYGPSETTNICTVRKVQRGDSSQFLGWAFENTSTFVCYPGTNEVVPIGCLGEFCFGGDQVAAGYLQMPELTAEKFFNHPEYGRIYRSGDKGRMLPDGSLMILGRIDTQIKLRGLRIELQEIQRVGLQTGLAKACEVIIVTQRSTNTEQLALFFVPAAVEDTNFQLLPLEDSLNQARLTLQQELEAALPDYMVPVFLVPISTLPQTSSGKVDRRHLKETLEGLCESDVARYSSQVDHDKPSSEWTQVERVVAQAAADTANINPKTITQWTSFATLGIDSILAMGLSRRLQTVLNQRVPLSLVLKNPSVGRLAAALSKASIGEQREEPKKELLPRDLVEEIQQKAAANWGEVQSILPCTPLQEGMLFAYAGQASATSYCNTMLFRLQVPMNDMITFWKPAFKRHGILRTCFASTNSISRPVVQVILSEVAMSHMSFEIAENDSLDDTIEQIKRVVPPAVDSGKPPVLLATITTPGKGAYLCFACHHALYDGISVKNLLMEIETVAKGGSLLPPVHFETFLKHALEPVSGSDEFWRDHCEGFVPALLTPDANIEDSAATTISTDFTLKSLESIELILKDSGISLLSLCQASWAITLSILQGSQDVCFGNVVSGRSLPMEDIDRLIAPCFNTIPMRVDVARSSFNLDLTKRVQTLNRDSLPFQFTPLRQVQKLVANSTRLLDSILILQPGQTKLDEHLWRLEKDDGAMDVPLVCEVTPDRERNVLRIGGYRQSGFVSHDTLHLAHNIFQHVLFQCLEHPYSQIIARTDLPDTWKTRCDALQFQSTAPQRLEEDSKNEVDHWSETEQLVRDTVARLTGLTKTCIAKDKPLFHYAVDSIGVVQIVGMLEKSSLSVSVADVMENPTCARIAAKAIARESRETQNSHAKPFDFDSFRYEVRGQTELLEDFEDILPCTTIQQAMLSQSTASDERLYFNYVSWELIAEIDGQSVVDAWKRVREAHQILRTGFVPVDSKTASYAMVVHVTNKPSEQDGETQIIMRQKLDLQEWRREAVDSVFNDLSNPPWRVVVTGSQSGNPAMHLVIHHALYDAHSLQLLLKDLELALSSGESLTTQTIRPALSTIMRYSEDDSKFWMDKAASAVVNKFPTMTPLVEARGVSAASIVSQLSFSEIKSHAADLGVSVQAALQVAWSRLLSAYLGEVNVTFGVVRSGRSTQQDLEAAFPMISTLPVISSVDGTVHDQLQHMMHYNAGLLMHFRTPLSSIQNWLGMPGQALFDTILVYQVADSEQNVRPWRVVEEHASVEYAVSLEIEESANSFKFNLVCDTSILPKEQARILLCQFDALLIDTLSAGRDDSSTDMATMLSAEMMSILPARTPTMPCDDGLLHKMVESSSRRNPEAIALEFVEELDNPDRVRRWTYAELEKAGNRVANFLLSKGVPQGSIVAVCFNKTPEAYFSIYGILKAGCCFLALDPTAPATRQEFILSDSGANCLLAEDTMARNLGFESPVPVHSISMGTISQESADSPQLSRLISPAEPSYCLYTSGTTGTPKGCLISHENTVQAMLAFTELFSGHWTERSRWLQFASLHFDVSVLEQYWSWYVGITVVSAPRDLILSNLIETISQLRITHIDLTPSLARLVHPHDVPSLCEGVFITGGEQLRQDVLEAWGPEQVIYNAYGPTEATIGVTMYQRVPANGRPSNIGQQFPNVGSYVLKPGTDEPVLRGAVGELCVSGKLVGIGYLNRPELTTERFAYLERFNERVYRTGDLVRVLHDGTFDFLGRADDQVKLRGQRLEIGEINHVIKSSLPYSADVATLVSKHGGQQDRDHLVSFITTTAERDERDELRICIDKHAFEISSKARNACKGQLSGYMVPSYILCVPWIPLSANNKADIKRLKSLFQELSLDDLRLIATGTKSVQRQLSPTESRVAKIVSEITGVDQSDISHSSTILELGIDSISVTRLSRALRFAGFDRATPSMLLKNGQIECISGLMSEDAHGSQQARSVEAEQLLQACYQQNLGVACEALGVGADEIEYVVPCTPLQEGMIARARAHTGATKPYFNQFELKLKPNISMTQVKEAWIQLQDASSILRTAFVQSAEGFIQVAVNHAALRWTETIAGTEELEEVLTKRHAQWTAMNEATIVQPFEIDCVDVSGEKMLVIRIFHALYDAHSLKLMFERVAATVKGTSADPGSTFYDALQAGPLLPSEECQPFWTNLFGGWPERSLAKTVSSNHPCSISRNIAVHGFEHKRKALGVTHQAMFQTAWFATLHEYLQAQPCFGVVYSGRSIDLSGAENVIGPLFNTLPFTTRMRNDTTWDELTRQIQGFNVAVLDFVHTPLRSIQKWCSNGRPLFDSLFTFDREDIVESKGDELWDISGSSAAPDYTLALECSLALDGRISVHIVAQNSAIDTENLLDQLEIKLKALINSDEHTTVLPPGMVLDACDEDNSSRGSRTTGDPTPRSASPTTSSVSAWPEERHDLRHEIALLAGVTDDDILPSMTIFDFGLDSIDAIRLASKAASLGYRVSPGDLLRGATIDSIIQTENMEMVSSSGQSGSAALGPVIKKLQQLLEEAGHDLTDVEAVLPNTPLQDAMVAEMIASRFQRYFNHEVFKIPTDVHLDRSKSAWVEVYANSPILRTTFAEVSSADVASAYCQVVRRSALQVEEVTSSSLEEIGSVLDSIRDDAASQTDTSGLFKLTVCHIRTDTYMIVSIAHALYDGQSLGMIYDDVQEAYHGNSITRPDYKPHLARLASTTTDAADNFWSNTLHNVQPTCLKPSNQDVSAGYKVHRQELDSYYSTSTLKVACRNLGVTPQVLAQASWAVVLASMAQNLQPTFGLVLSGRDTNEVQQMNFPTMNTVAMRAVLHGTVKEFLRHIQTTMSHIMEYQHTPLRQIQKLANSQGRPLFNTLFVFQTTTATDSTRGPLMIPVQGTSAVEYPVCVEFELTEPSPSWRVACDSLYGTEQSTNKILANLNQVMQFFCQGPGDRFILEPGSSAQEISICGLQSFVPDDKLCRPRDTSDTTTISAKHENKTQQIHPDVLHVIKEISGADTTSIQLDDQVTSFLDSISAIKACALLRKRGVKLSVRQMLSAGTIGNISALVGETSAQSSDVAEPKLENLANVNLSQVLQDLDYRSLLERASIPTGVVDQVLPALPMQVYMLSVWQNTSGALFWPTFRYNLKGSTTRERVTSAWQQVVEEIPMLRTQFLATGADVSPFLQVVLRPGKPAVEEDLKSDKLWTWHTYPSPFVQFSATQHEGTNSFEISLRIHHALYDAFSLPMITGRFEALCKDGPSSTALDNKLWEPFTRLHLSPRNLQCRKEFWASYLLGAISTNTAAAPEETPESVEQTMVSEYRPAAMPVHERLTSAMAVHGVTMQHLFFAAYARILAQNKQLASDSDITIGIYLSNRSNLPGLDAMPCPTLALLPLRARQPLGKPVLELAKEIKQDIEEISKAENISAGLWEIEKWTGVVVDTFVNFLPTANENARSNDASGVSLELISEPQNGDVEQGLASVTGMARPKMLDIVGNHVRQCHLSTVDIEAAVRNGSLDIGVFAQPGKLSREQAAVYIDEVVRILEHVE